ncbi:transporter [Desulfosarcina ovata subsp. ovata]|uniref:Transporter n=2 Tax=Desulfosarcina ovata TaxID=83564 RepID=A0A5K8AF35_9BACT|nr:transporter [Desulfosarcina ovata subsp. ovata]
MAVADESVKSARADLLPKISAGYGYTALKEDPVLKMASGDVQIASRKQYNWNVTAVQPLFSGFALSSRYNIARLDTLSRTLEKDQTILDLTRSVCSACYTLLLAGKILEVRNDEVHALIAHKRDAQLFFSQGLIPPNDRLKADVALSNALQEQERAKANVRKAVIGINRLLNRSLESELVIKDAPMPVQAYDDLAALSERALKDRPILRLVDIGMKQLELVKKASQSAWYPQISVVGSYAKTGDNPSASSNEYSDSDGSYVGVKLEWNFWQSGKIRAEVNRTCRQMEALDAKIENLKAQVLEEVSDALIDCQLARTNIATAEKALSQARENWRITDLQYQQQVATSSDVLDARSFLTQADTNYYRAVYGYLDAVAGLERTIGKKPSSALVFSTHSPTMRKKARLEYE